MLKNRKTLKILQQLLREREGHLALDHDLLHHNVPGQAGVEPGANVIKLFTAVIFKLAKKLQC
jgi:hypothetical protein